MIWNWQQKEWPNFHYDSNELDLLEDQFLHQSGLLYGAYKHISPEDKQTLRIDLMSTEALKTSEIEGEYLNRESIQSSIRKNFGLKIDPQKVAPAELGVANMMIDLYENYAEPLNDKTLFEWHAMLMSGRQDLNEMGKYRTHKAPMQIVSGPLKSLKVHFEAPPSSKVSAEMNLFTKWFNHTAPKNKRSLPVLTRAGITHLWFVCIHPFEDGNGRIGRTLSEKALSQSMGQPALIALSLSIQNKKKAYYDALKRNNQTLEITDWLIYFAKTILDAQCITQQTIDFLIAKGKFYDTYKEKLNKRQEKVINKIFQTGLEGFKGGLSAENYISITTTSRATATRDLQDLVEKGVFHRTGDRKSARYHLSIWPNK